MCALARVGKGIKTTMLLHWATNSLGFFAAWLLLNSQRQRPAPPVPAPPVPAPTCH